MEAKLRSALRRRWAGRRTAGQEHLQEEAAASSPDTALRTSPGGPRAQRDPEMPGSHQLSICVSARFFICLDNTEGA